MTTQQISKPDIASMLTDVRNPKFDEALANHVKLGNIAAVEQILTGTNVTPFVKRNIVRDAVVYKQLPMITYLIQRDDFASDLMLRDVATESKYNLLDYAIVLDQTEVALHILARHMDDMRQMEPPVSFAVAVERNNRDVLRALLQHSRHSYFIKNYQEQINAALVTAARRGFTGIVEEILTKNHLDPDVAHIGQAIKLATTHGHIDVIDMLAKTYHFDLSDDQWELFRAACLSGQAHVVTWLLLQAQVRIDHLYLVDTFLTVVKSDKQPVNVVRVLLDHTNLSFTTDVQPRKLLVFLKRHLRYEMFDTLCTHLVAKGLDVRAILLDNKFQTELATMLQSPDKYHHDELLLACIDVGDLEAIKQMLQVSSSVDLAANEYKALQKAIEFNNRDIALSLIHHPAFKITSFKFIAVLHNCLQRVKSENSSNMTPRLDLLKELMHALKMDVQKMIENLEAKYTGGMMYNVLLALAKH